jgi:hypothetical protein
METTQPLLSPEFLRNAAIVAGALVLLAVWFFWWKGRPLKRVGLSGESAYVFRASRLSRGNLLFPTQVLITPSSVIHFTPQWIGKREQAIHLAHIASMTIDTNLMFSDVTIETSGGTSTVRCHGHSKADAVRMKDLVERYQTQHYKKS